MAEVPSGERSQPALDVDGALNSIKDLLERVRVAQGLVSHSEADDHDNGSSHQKKNKETDPKEADRGSGFFGWKFSARRAAATAKERGVKAEASSGGGSWPLCIGGGGASAAEQAVGSPSGTDGARAAEIPEVKPGPHAEKAVGDQIGAGNRVAVAGPGDGGGSSGAGGKAVGNPSSSDGSGAAEIREVKPSAETGAKATDNRAAVTGAGDGGITSEKEVKPEAAATGSPMLPASSDTKDGSYGPGDDSNAKKDSSTKRPKGEKLKVYNQAEKLLRDLNNINSELSKLKALESHFQDLQNPAKKLDWVLDLEDKGSKATSVATPTLHKELQELADKVKVVKNQMPGHSALATNTDAGHNVDQETKFHDYHLLDKESVSNMKERVLGTPYFQGFLEDFDGAFKSLDRQSKLCLCCFSIFPEDAVVHKKLLVYWWIGEGLVDPQLHGKKAAADMGKMAAADMGKKAAGMGKMAAADMGKKAAGMGKKAAADMGKKAADMAKKAVDRGSNSADMGKKAADVTKKAADEGKKAVEGKKAADKAADEGNKAPNAGEKASDEGKKAASEVIKTANGVLLELCSKGFIEPVLKKHKVSGFKMDRLVRFAVIIIAEKLGFFSFDQMGVPIADFSSSHRACLVQNQEGDFSRRNLTREKDSGSSDKDKDKEKDPESSNKNKDNGKVKSMDHLHTLFNVNDPYPDFKLDWFLKLKRLNVLYLGGWQGSKGPHIEVESTEYLRGLRNMKYLKLLSLQGISRITDLPDSLCALTNLKILDLNACHHLESLPKQLGELKNLTHLDISECYLLDHIPKGLGQLYQLQVLKGFVVGGSGHNKDSCTLDDLKGLKNLRKLSITSSRDDFPLEKEVTVLQGFEHLKTLSIAWGGKSSKAEASPEEKVAKGKAAKRDQGKEKKKEEKRTSIEQQGRVNNAEQKKAVKEKGADKKVPVNTAEQKDVKGDYAGSKKGDKGGEAEQHDASAQQSAQPPSRAQVNWKKGKKLLAGLPLMQSGMEHNLSRLEKLELQCCPLSEAPIWMLEGKLKPCKKLYIKGGNLRTLEDGQGRQVRWIVKMLCLKYLADLEMDWTELQKSFPSLVYLEKNCCPKLTFFPCNSSGVWIDRKPVLFAEAKKNLSWSFLT